MKIREIILDFTSLLDVIMIILFFFILFSTLEVDTVTKSAEDARLNYEKQMEQQAIEQEELLEQLESEWERLLQADRNAAKNQQALIAYDQGAILAFNLQDVESRSAWTLNVLLGEEKLGTVQAQQSDKLVEKLGAMMRNAELDKADVIIGTLTYDGNSYGTAGAVPVIEDAIGEMQEEYSNLYFTTINISR